MTRRHRAAAIAVLVLTSCAPRLAPLPSGPGTPFPGHADALAEATASCRGVRTWRGVLELSGRAGETRIRSRIDAGFAEPARARLEAPAPFGRPIFELVASNDEATLLFPRDRRVLTNASPAAVIDALAGASLSPAELRSLVAGCGFAPDEPAEGTAYNDEWVSVAGGGSASWLRREEGAWRLVASTRGPLEVRYNDFASGRPQTIRLRRTAAEREQATDLTIRLSQVDINVPLGPEVFELEIPPDAEPLTLEELRRAGPLGGRSDRDSAP